MPLRIGGQGIGLVVIVEVDGRIYTKPSAKEAKACDEHYICACRGRTLLNEIERLRGIIEESAADKGD